MPDDLPETASLTKPLQAAPPFTVPSTAPLPAAPPIAATPIATLPLPELEKMLCSLSLPRFRSAQIFKWIAKGVLDYDQMTDIPLSTREELKKRFPICSSKAAGYYEDKSAAKIVIELKDGLNIEAVLLNSGKGRLTACLSTQAGCPGGCVFCKTGSLGFTRNLEAAEIVEQLLFLRQAAACQTAHPLPRHSHEEADTVNKTGGMHIIDNIVIMGMGEPLLNLTELRKAIAIITNPAGSQQSDPQGNPPQDRPQSNPQGSQPQEINFSKRRITVSTCGICQGLFDIAENGPYVRLALSLTTAVEPLRQKLMPITAKHPLQKVKEALTLFQHNGGGRITLEAVLLGGINTRSEDAASIASFAHGLDTVVNLIPWNPAAGLEFNGFPLREPDREETENYKTELENRGLKVTMRLHKGRRVMGACGQLGSMT